MFIMIGLAVAAAPVSAITMTADDRRTTVVQSKDLDLRAPAGERTLQRRVATAVVDVCEVSGRTIAELSWARQCRREAALSARGQVAQVVASARGGREVQLTAR